MSQRDGFAGGFLAGAIFGSVVGGFFGALIATRRDVESIEEEQNANPKTAQTKKPALKRQVKSREIENVEMEMARRSLEDKIAQLNATIDEVRQQLGSVNSNSQSQEINERPNLREELH